MQSLGQEVALPLYILRSFSILNLNYKVGFDHSLLATGFCLSKTSTYKNEITGYRDGELERDVVFRFQYPRVLAGLEY